MKTCTKCGLEKPLSEFHKQASHKDGLSSHCKACKREYQQAHKEESNARVARYRQRHPERVKAQRARYRQEHPEQVKAASARNYQERKKEIKARNARYRQKHLEQMRAREARYRQEHLEQEKARHARWYKKNVERVKAYHARYHKAHPEQARKYVRRRRAQKLAVSECFTPAMERLVYAFWDSRCAVCSTTERLCVDHWLSLAKGHALTMDNAVLLCRSCNAKKSAKLPEDIYTQKFVKATERKLRKQAKQWLTVARVP